MNSVSFEEQLKSKKQIFNITLENYRNCYGSYISSQNEDVLDQCNNYERKLNDILEHDLFLLQNSITGKLKKLNDGLNYPKNIGKAMDGNGTAYIPSDLDLASLPYKNELYTIKIWKFINLAYYFCGILGLMYFIKEQGATFIIKLAQQ